MWYLKLHTFSLPMLKDECRANALESALIMALVAVFIVASVSLMATEVANLFNGMAACLSDVVDCGPALF